MLLNISHNDPEIKHKINEAVGKPFSLIERLKLNGIGSSKLTIKTANVQIYNILQLDTSRNTCNIELRPKGIIIGFQKRLEVYALVIPYYKLNLYKGEAETYSFYKDTYFIKIEVKAQDTASHRFISKILNEKHRQRFDSVDEL